MTAVAHKDPLLEIRNLSVAFEVDEGEVQALDGVTLDEAKAKLLVWSESQVVEKV